jgi:hypothetical protein
MARYTLCTRLVMALEAPCNGLAHAWPAVEQGLEVPAGGWRELATAWLCPGGAAPTSFRFPKSSAGAPQRLRGRVIASRKRENHRNRPGSPSESYCISARLYPRSEQFGTYKTKSGTRLPHSKTLPRRRSPATARQRLGVRQTGGALAARAQTPPRKSLPTPPPSRPISTWKPEPEIPSFSAMIIT